MSRSLRKKALQSTTKLHIDDIINHRRVNVTYSHVPVSLRNGVYPGNVLVTRPSHPPIPPAVSEFEESFASTELPPLLSTSPRPSEANVFNVENMYQFQDSESNNFLGYEDDVAVRTSRLNGLVPMKFFRRNRIWLSNLNTLKSFLFYIRGFLFSRKDWRCQLVVYAGFLWIWCMQNLFNASTASRHLCTVHNVSSTHI